MSTVAIGSEGSATKRHIPVTDRIWPPYSAAVNGYFFRYLYIHTHTL